MAGPPSDLHCPLQIHYHPFLASHTDLDRTLALPLLTLLSHLLGKCAAALQGFWHLTVQAQQRQKLPTQDTLELHEGSLRPPAPHSPGEEETTSLPQSAKLLGVHRFSP